jgi:hypothetical protein
MNDLTLYNSVKDQLKTGDLLQWHSNSLIGKLIRTKTGWYVNHSSLAICFSQYEGEQHRRFTVEALEHGTVLHLLSKSLEQHKGEVWWYPLVDTWNERRNVIGERALEYIGIPYDYLSIVKQLVGRVNTNVKKMFCSEYCYFCYGFTGIAPNPGEMPNLGIFKDPIKIL